MGSASLGSDGLSLCSIALLSVELTGALDAAQLLLGGLTLSVATLQTVDRFFLLFFLSLPDIYTHTANKQGPSQYLERSTLTRLPGSNND